MSWFKELFNIEQKKLLVYIIFVASLILPGFGYIYLFNNTIFLQIDIFKLIILSVFYSLPINIIGIIYWSGYNNTYGKIVKKTQKIDLQFFYSISIFTLVISFISFAFYFMNILHTQTLLQKGTIWSWTWFKNNFYLLLCFVAIILAFLKPGSDLIKRYKKIMIISIVAIILALLLLIIILIKMKKTNLF